MRVRTVDLQGSVSISASSKIPQKGFAISAHSAEKPVREQTETLPLADLTITRLEISRSLDYSDRLTNRSFGG